MVSRKLTEILLKKLYKQFKIKYIIYTGNWLKILWYIIILDRKLAKILNLRHKRLF